MNKKILLLDVDDVLLNWYSGFERYMRHLGYESNGSVDWDLSKRFDTSKKEMEKIIKTFNKRWEFGTLDPLPNAQKVMKKLSKDGWRFVAISSCSTDLATIALRRTNLYWCYGDIFDAVHCLNLGESKESHLADYNPTWWIEDKFENAVAGLKFGHKSILLNYPTNKDMHHPDLIRCDGWKNIYDIIKNNDT